MYSDSQPKRVITFLHISGTRIRATHTADPEAMPEKTIPTGDGLRGNRPYQVQSPPCIDQRSLVPCEPCQFLNLDDSRNGWQVGAGSLPQIGQEREPGGQMDQEGLLGWVLVQLEYLGEHRRKCHFLGSPVAKDPVNNILWKDTLAHTGTWICTVSGTPGPWARPTFGYVY